MLSRVGKLMARIAVLIILILSAGGVTRAEVGVDEICDMGAARHWCDCNMLQEVEGIWKFPEDDTFVLVRRSALDDDRYDIVAVESPDVRLTPGENIGYLERSAVSRSFEMALYRNKEKGVFGELGKCLAEYRESEAAMVIKRREVKLSLNPRWILPSFWRMLKVSVKDPLESLPWGMIKVYPESVKREVEYL